MHAVLWLVTQPTRWPISGWNCGWSGGGHIGYGYSATMTCGRTSWYHLSYQQPGQRAATHYALCLGFYYATQRHPEGINLFYSIVSLHSFISWLVLSSFNLIDFFHSFGLPFILIFIFLQINFENSFVLFVTGRQLFWCHLINSKSIRILIVISLVLIILHFNT